MEQNLFHEWRSGQTKRVPEWPDNSGQLPPLLEQGRKISFWSKEEKYLSQTSQLLKK
jgi:hypothetical protein